MKKYIVIGSVAVFVLAAVSVFALQGKDTQTAAANEVAPLAASASVSGCGANGFGCGSSAGCGSAAGGCGAQAESSGEASQRIDQITAYLVDYYTSKRGLSDITVEIESFGCHEEATVKRAGQVVEKLSINGNRITKLES